MLVKLTPPPASMLYGFVTIRPSFSRDLDSCKAYLSFNPDAASTAKETLTGIPAMTPIVLDVSPELPDTAKEMFFSDNAGTGLIKPETCIHNECQGCRTKSRRGFINFIVGVHQCCSIVCLLQLNVVIKFVWLYLDGKQRPREKDNLANSIRHSQRWNADRKRR